MMLRVLGSIFVFVLCTSTINAQPLVRFVKDRDTLKYAPCRMSDRAFVTIKICNTSDQHKKFDLASTSPISRWKIISIDDTAHGINNIPVAPLDTLVVKMELLREAPEYLTYPDTFTIVGAGEIDTLSYVSVHIADTVSLQGDLNFGSLPVDESLVRSLTLTNNGSYPFPLDNLSAYGLTISGMNTRDSLGPGQSTTFNVLFSSRYPGRHFVEVYVSENCLPVRFASFVRVYTPEAYWTRNSIDDTLRGCGEPVPAKSYEMQIRNDGAYITIIDSIIFRDNKSNGWSFDEAAWRNVRLTKGKSLPFVLHRSENAGDATLEIRANGTSADRFEVSTHTLRADPSYEPNTDTVYRECKPGDTLRYPISVVNRGDLPYFIDNISLSDPHHWSVQHLSEGFELLPQQKVKFNLRFKGSFDPGSYPVTLSLGGRPCDTSLTRTVIVTVPEPASVVAEPEPLVIFPSPARETIFIKHSRAYSFQLLNLLGVTVRSGDLDTEGTLIDVRDLPRGSYILRVVAKEGASSRNILLR